MLNNLKMFQSIFNCFYLFRRRMLPRLFQFLHCIRCIIHWQTQTPLYLCYISGMYLEAIFLFYVLFNHLVSHHSFGLYASALLAILSSSTLPSPSPNSTFTLITLSGFLWESITTVSTCVDRVIEMHFPEFSLYSGSEKCCNPL